MILLSIILSSACSLAKKRLAKKTFLPILFRPSLSCLYNCCTRPFDGGWYSELLGETLWAQLSAEWRPDLDENCYMAAKWQLSEAPWWVKTKWFPASPWWGIDDGLTVSSLFDVNQVQPATTVHTVSTAGQLSSPPPGDDPCQASSSVPRAASPRRDWWRKHSFPSSSLGQSSNMATRNIIGGVLPTRGSIRSRRSIF